MVVEDNLQVEGALKSEIAGEGFMEFSIDAGQNETLKIEDSTANSRILLKNESGTVGKLNRETVSGPAYLDLSPNPLDEVSDAFIRLFRDSHPDSKRSVLIMDNSTVSSQIGVGGEPTFFGSSFGDGKVGIGIANPLYPLHIAGTGPGSPPGPEMISNGDFSSGDMNWTINDNTYNYVDYANKMVMCYNPDVSQYISPYPLVNGATYMVEFDLVEFMVPDTTFQVHLGGHLVYEKTGVLGPEEPLSEHVAQTVTLANPTDNLLRFSYRMQFQWVKLDNVKVYEVNLPEVAVRADGAISAHAFVDNTPGFEGTPKQALEQVVGIRSASGHIDHSTLPDFARVVRPKTRRVRRVFPSQTEATAWLSQRETRGQARVRPVQYNDTELIDERVRQPIGEFRTLPNGQRVRVIPRQGVEVEAVVEEGVTDHRDLGAMITLLTESVKALKAENEQLRARIETLERRRR